MTDAVDNPMKRRAPEEFFRGPALQVAAAIKYGDKPSLEAHLAADPTLAEAEGTAGMTMMLWAASLQEVDAVAVLLRHKADPNRMIAAGNQKFQLLALAAGGDNDALFNLLLASGADPNSVDNGVPAMFNAFHARRWDRVKQLLDAGADIDKPGELSSTPVIYLAKINEWAEVEWFIERGADVRAKDAGGATLADYVRSFSHSAETPNGQAHARVRRMLELRGLMPPPAH